MFRRGYIYWARLPGDLKLRPSVVLSPARRNDLAETIVLVPCTTRPHHWLAAWHVPLAKGEGGLSHASVVKCEDITALAKSRVDPTALGGPLSAQRLDEIRDALLRALDFA